MTGWRYLEKFAFWVNLDNLLALRVAGKDNIWNVEGSTRDGSVLVLDILDSQKDAERFIRKIVRGGHDGY